MGSLCFPAPRRSQGAGRSPKDGLGLPPSSQHCPPGAPLSEDPTLPQWLQRRRSKPQRDKAVRRAGLCPLPLATLVAVGVPPRCPCPSSCGATSPSRTSGGGRFPATPCPAPGWLGVCPPQGGATVNARVSSSQTPACDSGTCGTPSSPPSPCSRCPLARPALPASPRTLRPVGWISVLTPSVYHAWRRSHASLLAAPAHRAPAAAPAPPRRPGWPLQPEAACEGASARPASWSWRLRLRATTRGLH